MEGLQEALKLLHGKFTTWLESIVVMLPNFFIALIVLVVIHYLSKKLQNVTKKLLNKFIDNQALVNFLGGFTRVAVVLFGALVAIKILNLDDVVFSILAGVGIAGLAIGFAFQDIAANFIAGMALVFRKNYPFRVGDIIETNEHMGAVKEIFLRDTLIQTFQGHTVFIPNKLIFENAVINYSLLGRRRIDLGVGISYGDDLEKVRAVTIGAVKDLDQRIKDQDIELFYSEFGNSSINFYIRFWVPFAKQTDFLKAQSDAIVGIKKAYDKNDITIPFPIRTLDFGIKGGTRLDEVLKKQS